MFWDSVLDVVFPPQCLGCASGTSRDEAVCAKCFAGIKLHNSFFCGECGARLPSLHEGVSGQARLPAPPGRRICHRSWPYILGAAADYDDPVVKNLIHSLKFQGVKRAALPLAQLLINYLEKTGGDWRLHLLLPVPLGKKRMLRRGYNQAAEIARPLAEHFRLTFREGLLERTRDTAPQSEIKSREERQRNLEDCFRVGQKEAVQGRKIILLDDVTTSGATFLAAAGVLKAAGARSILALAAAKA